MPGLLHIVTATLRADAPAAALADAEARARALASAPGVERVLLGRTAERLVVASWLSSREHLEAFAASPEHMAFVMRGLAPVIAGMWSAAVEADSTPSSPAEHMWAFAIPERPGVYEWQVREFLEALRAGSGRASAGDTVEERERFRAAGVVTLAESEAREFESQLPALRERRADLGPFEEAFVPVLPS